MIKVVMSNNNQKLQRRLWKISQSNNEFSKIQCFRKEVGNECFKQILFSVHKSSGDTISHLLSRLNKIKTLRSLYNEFKDGWNALHLACRTGDLEMVKYLYNNNCSSVKVTSNNGRSPLHTAALHGKTSVVKFLVDVCEIPITISDSCGSCPLMDACRSGVPQTIQACLSNSSFSESAVDKRGFTCLHAAAEAGQPDSIRFLVESLNFDVNRKVEEFRSFFYQQTALHVAYMNGQDKCVETLLQLGALSDITDCNGRLASELTPKRRLLP